MMMKCSCAVFVMALLHVAHGVGKWGIANGKQRRKFLRGHAKRSYSYSWESKMTADEQQAVVDRHNQLRAMHNKTHQPCTAADMEAMVWDEKLATEAQAWADSCVGDHADGAGSEFGENIFVQFPDTKYTVKDLVGGVQGWYDEIVDTVWDIKDRKVTSKPLDQCKERSGDTCNVGHYFQVVWAKSNKIGCGVSSCKSGFMVSGADYGSGVLMVCRYQTPASLGAGQTNSLPYIYGKPCAACPDSCSNGLCTAPPTRCLDKLGGDNGITIGATKFTSCKDLVKAHPEGSSMPWCSMLAGMMKAEDTCALSCGKCKVPAGVGAEYCGGAAPAKAGADAKGSDAAKEKAKPKKEEKAKPKDEKKAVSKENDEDKKDGEGNDSAAKGTDSKGESGEQKKSQKKKKDDDDWGWGEEEDDHHGDGDGDGDWGWGDDDDWHDKNGDGDGDGELEGDDEDGWMWELRQKKSSESPNENSPN